MDSVLYTFPCDFPGNTLLRLEFQRVISHFIVIVCVLAVFFPTCAVLRQVIKLSFRFVIDRNTSAVLRTVVVPANGVAAGLERTLRGFEGENVAPMIIFAHAIAIRSVLGWWA
jgi:hypothetical protein